MEDTATIEIALRKIRFKDSHDYINDEFEELRTKIEWIEQQAIEEFNSHMDTVLELLEYGNLERIWLERTEKEGFESSDGLSSDFCMK